MQVGLDKQQIRQEYIRRVKKLEGPLQKVALVPVVYISEIKPTAVDEKFKIQDSRVESAAAIKSVPNRQIPRSLLGGSVCKRLTY